MRLHLLIAALLIFPLSAFAADSCTVIHGRARLYSGDSQLRIWHVGTHHDFEPDETSWDMVMGWLNEGTTKIPADNVMLFGNFTVCPTEPFRKGAVQHAKIISVKNRHYVRLDD
jgi:hypothetical protein